MKTLSISTIILLISISLLGQDFAPINATWYYTECFDYSGDIDYILFKSEKDTVINDTACRKISKRHQVFDRYRPKEEYITEINNKVFFFDTVFNQFQTLYDFNTQVGDYWDIKIRLNPELQYDTVRVKVDSIKNITINDSIIEIRYVTYFRLSQKNNPDEHLKSQIFEKIGDINYMFNWYYLTTDCIDFYFGNRSRGLRCYEDDDFGLYHHDLQYACDYVNVGINETFMPSFTVFPNPTKDIVKIEGNNSSLRNSSICLYDLYGNVLFSKEFCTEINMSPYSSGIYFVSISDCSGCKNIIKVIKE